MQLYIWKYDWKKKLTDNYHEGGGAIAIAPDLETARRLLADDGAADGGRTWTDEPDLVIQCEPFVPFAQVFPDKGCC